MIDDNQEWSMRVSDVLDSLEGLHEADRARMLALNLARAAEVIASLRADVDHWRTMAQARKRDAGPAPKPDTQAAQEGWRSAEEAFERLNSAYYVTMHLLDAAREKARERCETRQKAYQAAMEEAS